MNSLWTPSEAAEFLGVKLTTIYSWTHTGFIPHVKLGKLLRFDKEQICKWVETKQIDVCLEPDPRPNVESLHRYRHFKNDNDSEKSK